MAVASLVLVACFAVFGTLPASAQEGKASGSTFQDAFDDEPPVKPIPPSKEHSGASDSERTQSDAKPLPPVDRGAQEAAAEVERQVEAAPEPAAVTAKLAIRDALDRKDAPAAERLFQTALKRFPNDRDLREAQDGRALRLHEEKARAIFGRAMTDGTRLFGRQWEPGRTMEDGESAVTLMATRRGRPAKTSAVDAALTEGYAYINRGDPARAEKVLSGAIRRHDNSAELYYARVLARGLGGDLKKADEDSLRAVKLSREQPVALSQRASLMMTMGRREEAFAWASRALEGDPQDAAALVIRGRVLWLDRKRPDLAMEDFKKAARIDPEGNQKYYEAWSRLFLRKRAMESMGKGDIKQALTDTDAILASDPADAQAHTIRGGVFLKAGRVEEVIKETTLALKSDPRSTWALVYRGMAMETLGARNQALADFKRAVAIDPARFRADYEKLKRAQRTGDPPLWVRDDVLADTR